MFYGANGHWDYNHTIDQQIEALRMMGMEPGYYRVAWEGPHTMDYLVNLATALRETGIDMICCINLSMVNERGELYASEGEAYHAGWMAGAKVAAALAPLGVTIFQTGNELDAKEGIRVDQRMQGGVPEDFRNSHFPSLRGVINGCAQAVRTVGGPHVQIASNCFTACSIACSDMLWDGMQPDGSGGHPKLRWDITTWNNYQCYGSMLDMSLDYMKPRVNLLDHCKSKYGVPIIVTEWNGNEGDTDDQRTEWAKQFMDEIYWSGRELYGVEALVVYQLICGDPWGVINYDMSLQHNFGRTVRDFIMTHPA
ncbi:hypothetical protein OKW45_001997 [Paraburkholderia sp. WSM4175]|uniref:hypothetical protein n=1 Tax=Paraburkholderia sp. WSM4175 TaxID=2991072 RepID=UPI003D212003